MNVSLRSVQLFRFDSGGVLKVGLPRRFHFTTSNYQVINPWFGVMTFVYFGTYVLFW